MERLKARLERTGQNANARPRSPPTKPPTTTPAVVQQDEPQEETPTPKYEWDPPEAMQRILAGEEIVISHAGASQYTAPGGGVSACGIAALNCLHIIFEKERNGLRGRALLENIMTREVAEEITAICSQWSSKSHLEVEDIFRVPLFERSLRRVDSRYARPGLEGFRNVLSTLESGHASKSSSAIVITRPPEIIACLKIMTETKPVFVVFDSHPRPKHPHGAGFIFNMSSEATIFHLHKLLAVDRNLLFDRDMQWQAELLGSFGADLFLPQESINPSDDSKVILDLSMATLLLKSELADLKNQHGSLNSDHRKLLADNRKLKEDLKIASRLPPQQNSSGWFSYLSWPDSTPKTGDSSWGGQHIPREFWNPVQTSKSNKVTQNKNHDKHTQAQPKRLQKQPSPPKESKESKEDAENIALVFQLQHQFDEENRALLRERQELGKFQQTIFKCGICMDDIPDEDVAHVEECQHAYCRDCLRQHIVTKVKEHRFPITCPTCAADTKSKKEPAVVNQQLVHTVGIPEKDYAVFEDLQLTAFSIPVSCRTCQRTSFVDKQEYHDSKNIRCPLPDCQYMWCKACQQPVGLGGPAHSCDGTNEFNHLIQKEGLKRCPGCQTPIQKITGCNHMTCTSPGCNMHFCYLCGDSIVQSSLASQIKAGLASHYSKCVLFETAGIV